jgi:hypothetical protein
MIDPNDLKFRDVKFRRHETHLEIESGPIVQPQIVRLQRTNCGWPTPPYIRLRSECRRHVRMALGATPTPWRRPFCPKSQSRSPSCRFTMVVTQHSAESLAPFNRSMSLAYRATRHQQAVF